MAVTDVTIFGAGRPEAGGRKGETPMDRRGSDEARRESATPGSLLTHGNRVGTAIAVISHRRVVRRVSCPCLPRTLGIDARLKAGDSERSEPLSISHRILRLARHRRTSQSGRTDAKGSSSEPEGGSRIGSRISADSNGSPRLPILGVGR